MEWNDKAVELLAKIDKDGHLTGDLGTKVHEFVTEYATKDSRFKVGDTVYFLDEFEIRTGKVTEVFYSTIRDEIAYTTDILWCITQSLLFASRDELIETYARKVFKMIGILCYEEE